MRANSKVAILVVSMFLLTALAPAVTVFQGSDDVAADTTTTGLTSAEAMMFTEETTDFTSLIYMNEAFPTKSGLDATEWRYDDTAKYWVNINEKNTASYGNVLTYADCGAFTNDQIKQDIIDALYKDDVINAKGEKYKVSGSTITIGTTNLGYAIDSATRVITIQLGSMNIETAYDIAGRQIDMSSTPCDSFEMALDGSITVYNSGTPVIDSLRILVLNDGTDSFYVMRNSDQSTSRFQFLQVTFRTNSATSVSLSVTKETASTYKDTINADLTFAGCYFSELSYARILTIDPYDGIIQPSEYKMSGKYTTSVSDGFGNGYSIDRSLGNCDVSVYGSVVDAEGSISGSTVTNALYGAAVTYYVTKESGETYSGTAKVASETDVSGEVKGFYLIEVEKNSKLEITDVVCDGYSFDDKTLNYGTVRGDIMPTDVTADSLFMAVEKTRTVTVKDMTGIAAPGAIVVAQWWYEYAGTVSTDYPAYAPGKPGSLPTTSFTTDKNGQVHISYSEPTGAGVNYRLLVYAVEPIGVTEDKIVYTFDVDDTTNWPSATSLPASLTKAGNVFLTASSEMSVTVGNEIKAKEYSFTVTIKSDNGRVLSAAGLKAAWYYRGTHADDKNTTVLTQIIDSIDPEHESAAKVNAVTTTTGSDGVIRLVYSVPNLYTAHWALLNSAFIYVYGTEYNFNYITNITDLTTDPDVSPYPGCEMLKAFTGGGSAPAANIFSGQNKDIISEDGIYTISGSVTAHSGSLPYSVRVIMTTSSRTVEETFYKSGGTLTYAFDVVGGSVPEINMFSDGYIFTNICPSIGTVTSDKVVDFESDYVGVTTVVREVLVPIGITTGYNVNDIEAGIIVKYTYTVGGIAHDTSVKATSTSTNFVVKGLSGLSVSITASNPEGKYYIEDFDSTGNASAVTLVETRYVVYKGETNEVQEDDTLLGKTYSVTIFYKDKEFGSVVPDSNGIAKVSVPTTGVTYKYNGYSINPISMTSGKYAGYTGFNLNGYISSDIGRIITITIEYYATSSIDNLSGATCKPIVYVSDTNPTKTTVGIGDPRDFTAPKLDGFDFAGWYLNGKYYSDSSNVYLCHFEGTADMDSEVTLRAYYSAQSSAEPDNTVDSTVVVIGIIAVVVAVLALVFVVFQSKRY